MGWLKTVPLDALLHIALALNNMRRDKDGYHAFGRVPPATHCNPISVPSTQQILPVWDWAHSRSKPLKSGPDLFQCIRALGVCGVFAMLVRMA